MSTNEIESWRWRYRTGVELDEQELAERKAENRLLGYLCEVAELGSVHRARELLEAPREVIRLTGGLEDADRLAEALRLTRALGRLPMPRTHRRSDGPGPARAGEAAA